LKVRCKYSLTCRRSHRSSGARERGNAEGRRQKEVTGGAATGIARQNVSRQDPTEFSSSPYVIGGVRRTHRIMGRRLFYPFANRWVGGA
jgi:hypothetical protein